jgi:anti-sigma factor RsiW
VPSAVEGQNFGEKPEMEHADIGNPDCKKALALLHAYLSNELAVETTTLIGRHLDQCLACQREFGIWERLKERLQLVLLRDAVSPLLRKRISRLMRHSGGFWISHVFLG